MLKKSSSVRRLMGIIYSVLALFSILILMYAANDCGMFPFKFLLAAFLILLFIIIILFLIFFRKGKKKRTTAGIICDILFIIVMCLITSVVTEAANAVESITITQTEESSMCVCVLTDDPAESVSDLGSSLFGIVSERDRENTDAAIEVINDELGYSIMLTEYDSVEDLVNGLYEENCRAIITNNAFLDILEETEEYEDIYSRIRIIEYIHTEQTVRHQIADSEMDAYDGPAFTVFISGIDSRTGLNTTSRSDVNILAVVNPETYEILIVSTPRDYYIPLSISGGEKDKLTHAGIYGINVSMDTISMLYDVNVDYYVKVCFDGLTGIVDILGGIDVYSEYTFTTQNVKGYSFTKGYNHMDGKSTLAFVRERYAFEDGDRQRGRNQTEVIKGIINKLISVDTLMNYQSIIAAVSDNIATNIPYDVLTDLINLQLSENPDWKITTYSVDGEDDYQVPYSMSSTVYVMEPDYETVEIAKEKINTVLNGNAE